MSPVPVAVESVGAGSWRARAGVASLRGERPLALTAAPGADGLELRLVVEGPQGERVLRSPVPAGGLESIADLAPALEWDERELRDVHGLAFAGAGPHRPLVDHPRDLGAWTTPPAAQGLHQVAVGPIHAGVIESGHFRFHVVGERVHHVDLRLFYKRRGIERAAAGRTPAGAVAVLARACGACAVTTAVAAAQAVEQAEGLWPSAELARVRTLLLELERLWNHLNDLGAACSGIGLAAGAMTFAALKERAQRVNAALTGHRFLFGAVTPGGSGLGFGARAAGAAREEVAAIAAEASDAWRRIGGDASVRDRLAGTGVVHRAEAEELGLAGPSARACGVAVDRRSASPRLAYGGWTPRTADPAAGDVAARLDVRAREIPDTAAVLDELLARPVAPAHTRRAAPATGLGVGRVEGPRGETLCLVETASGRVRAAHLRTASYANWRAVALAATRAILPDFPLVNKSFELCYACVDR